MIIIIITFVIFVISQTIANDESLRGFIENKLTYNRPDWCKGDGGLGSPCGPICKCRDDTVEGPLSCYFGTDFANALIPTSCFHDPRRFKEPCSVANKCATGLSCAGDMLCYHSPRWENEPCEAFATDKCGDDLVCEAREILDKLKFICVKKDR